MKLSNFDYNLPKELIAQKPISPRDSSKLLVLNRKNGETSHHRFFEINKYFKKGDVVVLNDSKVIPARLFGVKKTGGKIEVLLLRRVGEDVWRVLVKPGLRVGITVNFMKSKMKKQGVPEGDFRDWKAIRSWAEGLHAPLLGVSS